MLFSMKSRVSQSAPQTTPAKDITLAPLDFPIVLIIARLTLSFLTLSYTELVQINQIWFVAKSCQYKTSFALWLSPQEVEIITFCCSDFFHFRFGNAVIELLDPVHDIRTHPIFSHCLINFHHSSRTMPYFKVLCASTPARVHPTDWISLHDDQYFLADKWPRFPLIIMHGLSKSFSGTFIRLGNHRNPVANTFFLVW